MIQASQVIVDQLEAIRAKLYRDQPLTMNSVEEIIDLLETIFCPHEWEVKSLTGDPAEPPERVLVCNKCGFEKS